MQSKSFVALVVMVCSALLALSLAPVAGADVPTAGVGADLAPTIQAASTAPSALVPQVPARVASDPAYAVARRYVIRFYPLWFSVDFQQMLSGREVLAGPATMTPDFGFIVAPNVDTVYALATVDVSDEPQILTIPPTPTVYSVMTADMFGTLYQTKLQTQFKGVPGTYALVQQGWHGSLPPGVRRVPVPLDITRWFFRADRYTADNVDHTADAEQFRASLHLASLSDYRIDPSKGATVLLPVELLYPQAKAVADQEIAFAPTTFLKELQSSVDAPGVQPFSASDARLARRFDQLLRHATELDMSRIILATQVAHGQIIDRWWSHVGPTSWVYFDNVGDWGTNYLDRAALTEYAQWGNSPATAGYYDAFVDEHGQTLDCSTVPAYILTFQPTQVPQAERFWSLTAYLPESVTLVPNPADKYAVARYTPNLVTEPDGTVKIYIQPTAPTTAPEANWLPVPDGPFNLLLRVYGPTGNTAPGQNYSPPVIKATYLH